eukprot:scaffold71935_cov16-Tisochrysis_lutea.AAC.5
MGADKLQQAMSETLGNEEAAPLFDQAGEHFRDAAVVSLIQWGNVFIVKADRLLQALTKAGKPIKGKDLDAVMALYDATQKKCVLYECMHSAVRHDGKKGGVKMQDAGEGKKGFRLICAAEVMDEVIWDGEVTLPCVMGNKFKSCRAQKQLQGTRVRSRTSGLSSFPSTQGQEGQA